MTQTIHDRRAARLWQESYDTSAPRVGDRAPDFKLHNRNGEKPIRLSSFRGQRPVALIFGSFT
jgi:peroxiredoxin